MLLLTLQQIWNLQIYLTKENDKLETSYDLIGTSSVKFSHLEVCSIKFWMKYNKNQCLNK